VNNIFDKYVHEHQKTKSTLTTNFRTRIHPSKTIAQNTKLYKM